MANVLIYTKTNCPYCHKAKQLLAAKGVEFKEIDLEGKPDQLVALKNRTGMRTVPQIFIGDELIGGYSELQALEDAKQLDLKLARTV